MHEKDNKKLKNIIKTEDLEKELNELVYKFYKIKEESDIKIIDDFLKIF